MTKELSFWESKHSEKYEDFATSIPSDIPAYEFFYHLLNPKGKTILDFGCFQGKSSKNLLKIGALHVVGIDNVEEHIHVAKRTYSENENLSFMYVPENSFIPSEKKFDSTCMSFVHPTIESRDVLKFQIQKIYEVTKGRGNLVLLGLHQNSFENNEFLFYKHRLSNGFSDGVPFANELKLPNGETIKFTDYCWTTETLTGVLQEHGFFVEGIYDLKESLEGRIGEVLRTSIKKVGATWKDEWKAPLYQVILARKSS